MAEVVGIAADEPRVENLFVGHVLPLVLMKRRGSDYTPIVVLGTAFTFGQGTVVTCWHCIPRKVGPSEVVAVVRRSGGLDTPEYDVVEEIHDLGRDTNGSDLALGRVSFRLEEVLPLAEGAPAWGSDVLATGYPLSDREADRVTSFLRLRLHARVLRGYITRAMPSGVGAGGRSRMLELDMIVPGGASGSPLFSGSPFEVIGVLAGCHTSEFQGVATTLGYAVHRDILAAAGGAATGGSPLELYLRNGRIPAP